MMAAQSTTAMEEFTIPAADPPGMLLYVRNKHPRGVKKFAPGKILLFVHARPTLPSGMPIRRAT
jgi:hypothetical protein